MIKITISSSILILVILLVRKCFYYQIPRRMQYALWLAIPVYLALVPFLHISIPLYGNRAVNGITKVLDTNILKNKKLPVPDRTLKDTTKIKSNTKEQDAKNNNIKTQNKRTGKKKQYYNPGVKKYLTRQAIKISRLLYGFICACIIFYILIKNIIFISKCLKNRKYYNTDLATGLKIYILRNINTPFLLGKSVYTSPEMMQNPQYFHYILLHEYCHWKHKDTLWVIVRYVIAALFWYNPVVWAAFYYEECDCELACDEAVIEIAGKDNILKYGDALLNLALNQVHTHKDIIIQTMAGRGKKMLKERISYIVSKKKNKRITKIGTVLIIIMTFTTLFISFKSNSQAIEKNKEVQNSNINDKTTISENKNPVIENCYYNCMKSDGVYIYYPWKNKLMRVCIETGENEKVIEAGKDNFFRLGDIADNYLYYAQIGDFATIGRISLPGLSNEPIYTEKSENSWGFGYPHIDSDGTVYCEEKMGLVSKCHMYKYDKDADIWRTENNLPFIEQAEKIENQLQADLRSDYIQSVTGENLMFFTSSGSYGLFIYDKDKNQLKKIPDYASNLMIMDKDKGFVYTDKKYNIHLCSYGKPYSDNIIFKPDKEMKYVNYGIYDKNGIYGYCRNKENKNVLVRISWNGEIDKLYTFSSQKDLSMMSAFGDSISFFDGTQFKLIKF